MAEGTARRPSDKTDAATPRLTPRAEPVRTSARTRRDESIAFLEAAAAHLREAGYFIELDFDEEAGEAVLFADGVEVRFVKSLPEKPLKH